MLIKVEGAVPLEFKVNFVPGFCSLKSGDVMMDEKGIEGFRVETIKLRLEVTKAGNFHLNPIVFYKDDIGRKKAFKANPITVNAQLAKPTYEALPGRVSTGTMELDSLLLGGIPENYTVALTAPSSDEKQLLIKRFLETGAKKDETTLCITCKVDKMPDLAKQYPNLSLVLCSPQVDLVVQTLPNICMLKGIDNLTEIDIVLTKYFRTLKPDQTGSKRACIDIVSDILLQHHTVTTRRWLSALLPTLKSKDFTILAVIDPTMHAAEETQAVLSLFDGEINIREKETPKGTASFLKIRKMTGQKYLKDEICLTEE
jgi:KaiC/GvpD/RAD55 family RecA-like ATPase